MSPKSLASMNDILGTLLAYFWIWIPLAGIAAGAFKDWLKSKERLAELGVSTQGLEVSYDELRKERDELVRRIQNLEAIVTHEVWDAANARSEDPERVAARIDAALLTPEESDADRAARLASRLRG